MTDEELANLLGEKPATPDPAFRFDVLARAAQHAQRRAAQIRALNIMLISCTVGAFFALSQGLGFRIENAQPLFYTLVAIGCGYVLAQETIKGRRSPFARAFAHLRFRL
jgi:hypothetical protein